MSWKRTGITSPARGKVAALLQSTSNPRDQERLIAARMAMSGQQTLAMMAKAVGRARACIQAWLYTVEAGGVDALLRRTPPPGRPPSHGDDASSNPSSSVLIGNTFTARWTS